MTERIERAAKGTSGEPATAAPIAVLTLNPSLDISYEVVHLVPDQKTHALGARYDPGGNGINVSRTLEILGVRAETFCLVAGAIGRLVEEIASRSIDALNCVRIPGETRINCAVLQVQPRIQYEMTADGAFVPPSALAAIEAGFLSAASRGFGVLTGSLPPGVPSGTYAQLVERLHEQGARAVVDARPELLSQAIAARPFLIKPNRFELETLCGSRLPTREDVARAAGEVQRSGVSWVCVSLGEDGAVLAGPTQTIEATPPATVPRSTVGAGDALLAGLVAGFARGAPPAKALRQAVACGSGTAEKSGTGLCNLSDVVRIAREVVVREFSTSSPASLLEETAAAGDKRPVSSMTLQTADHV